MKRIVILLASALTLCVAASAQDAKPAFKWYGFIRNYGVYDSHSSNAGTEDLYYYMPNDNDEKGTTNFVALTSRLGLDVTGYEYEGYKIGAKIETDFYSKNGTTAVLRLRQAYFTVAKDKRSWKIGQAWHPMAADMPDIFSLETGAPFGPFSRTPQVDLELGAGNANSMTLAAIWQMQYTSPGPEGNTANYIKYSGLPELYLAWNYKPSDKFLSRIGVDYLSIKPVKNNAGRSSTLNFYMYDQYTSTNWALKNKLTLASDGSHFNMVGGYASTGVDDGVITYAPFVNVSDWLTILYKGWGNWRPSMLLGYTKMFGIASEDAAIDVYAKLNAGKVNQLYRIQPEIVYNLGKVAFGLEYMMTSVQYGKPDSKMVVCNDLHWVTNHRIQLMAKYTF